MNLPAKESPKRPVIKAKRKAAQADPPKAAEAAAEAAEAAEPTITIPLSVWEQLQRLAVVGMERHRQEAAANAYVQALRRR